MRSKLYEQLLRKDQTHPKTSFSFHYLFENPILLRQFKIMRRETHRCRRERPLSLINLATGHECKNRQKNEVF